MPKYYEQIIISNEVYKKFKYYGKNKREIEKYYNVDRLIME